MNLRQAKLMLKLADYLHAFKEPKKGEPGMGFDMAAFYLDGENLCFGNRHHPCGTSADALGHAATMPCFRRLGLRLDKESGCVVFESPGDIWADLIRNFDAAEYVFGITKEESRHLFGDHFRTAKQEAAVLRRFVYKRLPQLKPVATKKKAVKK